MITILVLDDEAPVRQVLRRMLEPEGYAIVESPDAETALTRLAEGGIDAVFCDVQMPVHDGLWFVARSRERFPDLPIVMATAENRLPATVTLRDGVVAYVVKPFSRSRVRAAVQAAIEWRQGRGARRRRGGPEDVDRWLDPSGE